MPSLSPSRSRRAKTRPRAASSSIWAHAAEGAVHARRPIVLRVRVSWTMWVDVVKWTLAHVCAVEAPMTRLGRLFVINTVLFVSLLLASY